MTSIPNIRITDAVALAIGSWALYKFFQTIRQRVKTTKLGGPNTSNWLWGLSRLAFRGTGEPFEEWASEHGAVFAVPRALGGQRIILTDAKAIAHFYANETYTYHQSEFAKMFIENMIGRGIIWSEGDAHRRQRRTMSPAFTNAAIRQLVPVFYDSAYKVKGSWDALFESSTDEELIINVQKWMNCVSLDSIGIAGFGHDFGALEGKKSTVEEAFDALANLKPDPIFMFIILMGGTLPFLAHLPNKRGQMMKRMHATMQDIAGKLLARSRREKEAGGMTNEMARSIIGTLIRAENAETEFHMTPEEILAQMNVLILAGYETTSITLTWALMELSLNPKTQDRLRAELAEYANRDPTFEQLHGSLPYLDAVFREILRLHPPLHMTTRIAACDDVIPVSRPLTLPSGDVVDHVIVARGSTVSVPIRAINRSVEIWGPDAKEFKPERWLNDEAGVAPRAKEIGGYHHIMSFVDGQRMCLGRAFAVAEFKSVLSVLIKNYVFDMRDGPETKIEMVMTILPRPKVAGEEGYAMPMRVRRYEHA